MAKQIFVLYQTDVWHLDSNDTVIGVFTSPQMAIDKLAKNLKESEEFNALSIEDKNNLLRIYQTQGRDDNYRIEERTLNELEE